MIHSRERPAAIPTVRPKRRTRSRPHQLDPREPTTVKMLPVSEREVMPRRSECLWSASQEHFVRLRQLEQFTSEAWRWRGLCSARYELPIIIGIMGRDITGREISQTRNQLAITFNATRQPCLYVFVTAEGHHTHRGALKHSSNADTGYQSGQAEY